MTPPSPSRQVVLGSTEYTLLGLIARAEPEGPVHGYDLQRHLAEGSLAHVIRIEPGMMYHYLKKLAQRGLITQDVSSQQGRPARHLHTLTAEGRSMLNGWIDTPVQFTREMRLEFLLKLWFARQGNGVDRGRAERLIREQALVIDRHIASLESQIGALSADDDFGRAVLGLRVSQNHAIRTWLTELEHLS
jgi:PadR family transcriptional regulator, regulatory protein AphA